MQITREGKCFESVQGLQADRQDSELKTLMKEHIQSCCRKQQHAGIGALEVKKRFREDAWQCLQGDFKGDHEGLLMTEAGSTGLTESGGGLGFACRGAEAMVLHLMGGQSLGRRQVHNPQRLTHNV